MIWPFSKTRQPARPAPVRASFDAAQTTDENSNHWKWTDELSANQAHSSTVRKTVRERARYEVANNTYARGIVLTLTNDTIGTGPRLQCLTPDRDVNAQIELRWQEWADEVRLADKLWTAKQSKTVDGEAFAHFVTAEHASPITLDLVLSEAEQFGRPYTSASLAGNEADGVTLDDYGRPVSYHRLRTHPGDLTVNFSADVIPAADVVHLYRPDRPGQTRGVSEIVAALPLFAMLRRFTLATIAAAETAADMAAILHTQSGVVAAPEAIDKLDRVPIARRAILTMPEGWDLTQLKAEHPSTTYANFKAEIVNEISRCLNMPFNVAACNSAGYNFASGKLDHQIYFKSIRVERAYFERVALDKILAAWTQEAALIPGFFPPELAALPHQWNWPGMEPIDPVKEASAQKTRLEAGLTSYPAEYAKDGKDWETEQLRQSESLGIDVDTFRELLALKLYGQPADLSPEGAAENAQEEE